MIIFEKKEDISKWMAVQKTAGKRIGFVPTMGALHKGHLSLVETARKENDEVVVSIFINPTQFNNSDDLKNYPRTIEADKEMLGEVQTSVLFFPSTEEMYPVNEQDHNYDFGDLEKVMEGKHRPGHFKGVAQIVEKLFRTINASNAYFGEKDFQQLVIIRELVKKMKSGIVVKACPTVRERDGLAMSSRNMLLSQDVRKEASAISKALFFIRDNWRNYLVDDIRRTAINIIERNDLLKVEYLEIADGNNLQPVNDWSLSSHIRCFTAVKAGKIRLIDNVAIITTTA